MTPLIVILVVLAVYILGYAFYGRRLLERRIVKADKARLTPAFARYDGVDYVPANKYVLFGHHFASIAGAGPIVGPAIALSWGWLLPLIWVLVGNMVIGAVHDYLSLMSSVRYGGITIMSVSENVMGKRARYVFLFYAWIAQTLVVSAFSSTVAATFVGVPTAAAISILYMPLALLFGMLVYRAGLSARSATAVSLLLMMLAFVYSLNAPVYFTYEGWVTVLIAYGYLAATLPVWYLLQPRDYLNAWLLWAFVAMSIIAPLVLIPLHGFTGPAMISLVGKGAMLGAVAGTPPATWDIAWFWPTVPLVVACGALSGGHSIIASGTTSKQLANELDGLLVGYGGMLAEGAVSSLAVIMPAALVWDFATTASAAGIPHDILMRTINVTARPSILAFAGVERFYTGWGFTHALAWSRVFGVELFPTLFAVLRTFSSWVFAAFVLTTLDTSSRLCRLIMQEFLDWLKPRSPLAYRTLASRWVAGIWTPLVALALSLPKIEVAPGHYIYAYSITWPAFAGTNQLMAALALLTISLWVYGVQRVRGAVSALIMAPSIFLWTTVTAALMIWLTLILPYLPAVYIIGCGLMVGSAVALDFALLGWFIQGFRTARRATQPNP